MNALVAAFGGQVLLFVLVVTRLGGLIAVAPMWSHGAIPVRVRVFLAIGLALVVTPLAAGTDPLPCRTLVDLVALASRELAVGLCLGLAVLLYFAGLQLAGLVMGQMSGMSLADVVSPTFDASVPVFSELLHLVMLSVFLVIGGHRELLDALLGSLQHLPPGQVTWSSNWLDALTRITQSSFVLGLQIAAPVMVALLLSVLIMGLISRTLPQLNVLAVGFSINALVMLASLLLSLGILARVFATRCLEPIDILRPLLAWP